MTKTKEQERMEAAVALGILVAECPGVLAGIQKMLETPWFIPLGKGERKRTKNVLARLAKAVGKPGKSAAQADAPFDLRTPKTHAPATPPPAKILMAPADNPPSTSGSGGAGDAVSDRAPAPEAFGDALGAR